MIGEIWYYKAKLSNNDANNNLYYTDIHYCLISSSSILGFYNVLIEEKHVKEMRLIRKSVIKTTKLYTGPKTLFERKVCDLPFDLKQQFLKK